MTRAYDDDDYVYFPDGTTGCGQMEVVPVAPIDTGILDRHGRPLYRHPIVCRFGFHPPDKKFYCPTLEDDWSEQPGEQAIVNWAYEEI